MMKQKQKKCAVGVLLAWLLCTAQPVFASDLTYTFSGIPEELGIPTSTEEKVLETEATQNHNRGKTAAYIPPAFGSRTSYTLDAGERLTPNLLTERDYKDTTGITQTGNGIVESLLPAPDITDHYAWKSESWITAVTDALYYTAGHIGRLEIPKLDLSVRIYEGESAANMKKGIAHMRDSSVWDGNVALCGHNRGNSNYFGKLHTLRYGDKIIYTTKLGIRTYQVVSVDKILETDTSVLNRTEQNQLTLVTCVRNESAYRYCVTAVEVHEKG